MGELKVDTPLVFCGVEVELSPGRRSTLSQNEFYRQIPELQLIHFVKDSKMVLPERVWAAWNIEHYRA